MTYLVAGLGAYGIWSLLSHTPILAIFLADLFATLVVFGASRIFDNSSMYDPFWSLVPPLILLAWWGDGDRGRQVVVAIAVFIWASRLTWIWASRWQGLKHEDWRHDELRDRYPDRYWTVSLGGIHLFPTLQVFLGCLPLYPILTSTRGYDLWDAAAMVVLCAAITLEAVADGQLKAFKALKTKKRFCDDGLWAWCRHPNYLGEIGFWWGLYLLGVAANPGWWWSFIGALCITVVVFVVTAPRLDARNLARRPGYAGHVLRTWSIVPWPPPAKAHQP